jgi:hypothetical protein
MMMARIDLRGGRAFAAVDVVGMILEIHLD